MQQQQPCFQSHTSPPMASSIVIRAMISIRHNRTTQRPNTIRANMPPNRANNFGHWHRIYIVPKWNRHDRHAFCTTFNRLIIISHRKLLNQRNCDFFFICSVIFFFCRRGTRAKCYTRLYYYEYSFWGELLSFVDISQQSALLWDFFDRELQFFCKLEFCSDYSHYLLPSFSFSPSPDFLLDKVLPKYAIFV